MRTSFYGVLFVSTLLLSGCAAKTGAGTGETSAKSERRIVAVDVTNASSYTADVYVAGSLVSTLLPNESTTVPLKPSTHRPRVYAVATALGDANWDPRRRPRAVKLSVRSVYERVPVDPS